MNALIGWFAGNRVAANMLMLGIVGLGLLFIPHTPKEILPNIERDRITITVTLPGAGPEQVEQLLCTPIERSLVGINQINRLHSRSTGNRCTVTVDLAYRNDIRLALSQVDEQLRLVDLPDEASPPQVRQSRTEIMLARISVVGSVDYALLRQTAENVQRDLIARGLERTVLRDSLERRISISIANERLQQYQLSFAEVAHAIRQNAGRVAAGLVQADEGQSALVVSGQYHTIDDIANTVIRSFADGGRILLKDLATLHDGFADNSGDSRINGKPAISLSVYQPRRGDIVDMSSIIKQYVQDAVMPANVELLLVQDNSAFFTNRMRLLRDNAVSGLALVFAILLLFLRFRLAFWVTAGIPVAFTGGLIALYLSGGSINMVSTFGLLLVLGIVVDDAIIIGENIHRHQQAGQAGLAGAIAGASELARPVVFAVLTTAITFVPMFFLPNAEGRIAAQIPLIVIATLLFSLIECLLILPAHLAHHPRQPPARPVIRGKLEQLVYRYYRPLLQLTLRWRYVCVTLFACLFLASASLLLSDWITVDFDMAIEAEVATGQVSFAPGSDVRLTRAAVQQMEQAALALKDELAGQFATPQILTVRTFIGDDANTGFVFLNLATSTDRLITGAAIMRRWQEKTGPVPLAARLDFQSTFASNNNDFRVYLHAHDSQTLRAAARALKLHLQQYNGVYNIHDSFLSASREVTVQLNDNARAAGLDLQGLSAQIHATFVGTRLPPIERDGKLISVSLQLPEDQRNSLWHLENLPIRLADGSLVPLFVLASLRHDNMPDSIQHIDGQRVATVYAQLDENIISKNRLGQEIRQQFLDRLSEQYPGVVFGSVGSDSAASELQERLWLGFSVAMIVMFVLMASLFGSYTQPVIILSAVPFGMIGALLGHLLLNESLTWLSLTGIVAVSGIVVNDNMVLVYYINEKCRSGMRLYEAVTEAGVARFRPILLTTITTFFGLLPIMLENSWEAQFLIPMAISISFGVLFATFISLLLVPALYLIADDLQRQLTAKLSHTPA